MKKVTTYTPEKSYAKSKVSAHNLGQIGGKQAGATEACSQHVARSDSVVDSQDGLKCEHLLKKFLMFSALAVFPLFSSQAQSTNLERLEKTVLNLGTYVMTQWETAKEEDRKAHLDGLFGEIFSLLDSGLRRDDITRLVYRNIPPSVIDPPENLVNPAFLEEFLAFVIIDETNELKDFYSTDKEKILSVLGNGSTLKDLTEAIVAQVLVPPGGPFTPKAPYMMEGVFALGGIFMMLFANF